MNMPNMDQRVITYHPSQSCPIAIGIPVVYTITACYVMSRLHDGLLMSSMLDEFIGHVYRDDVLGSYLLACLGAPQLWRSCFFPNNVLGEPHSR